MTQSPPLNATQREILRAIGFSPRTDALDDALDDLEDIVDSLPKGSDGRRRYQTAKSLLLSDDVASNRPHKKTIAEINALYDGGESLVQPVNTERLIAEAPFDAARVARLFSDAASGAMRVALVNVATGEEFADVPLSDRSPESITRVVAIVRQMRDAMANSAPPVAPQPLPRPIRRGLNLVRRVEFTDDGVIYTERSGFAGSKAWAAQLVPREINISEARPRDYDYRFLDAFDESQSRSGRTGHANFRIVNEPDGVYVAESVWRSGESQREYFEVIDGSVTRHTPDVDEARSWMGMSEALDAKVNRLRAERSAVDREQSEKWSMAPLTAVSDKQRDYAERVRANFVQKFRTGPSYVKPLWPAVARVAKASWWLDYGNLQRRGINEILKDMLTARSRPRWSSAELPNARVMPAQFVTTVPFTLSVVTELRREYERRMEALYAATDYGSVRRAVASLSEYADAFEAFTSALAEGASMTWRSDVVAAVMSAARRLERRFIEPPMFRDAAASRQESEYRRFATMRGAWERESRRVAARVWTELAAATNIEPRIDLIYPRIGQNMAIGGVRVVVRPMPDTIARMGVEGLVAAIDVLRRQRRVPWLLPRLPPVLLTNRCITQDGRRFYGAYTTSLRVIELCASWAASEGDPRRIAQTIAHEAGHHIYRTDLSDDATASWRRRWNAEGAYDPPRPGLDAEEAFCDALGVMAAWGPGALGEDVQSWLRTAVPAVRPKANGKAPRKSNNFR